MNQYIKTKMNETPTSHLVRRFKRAKMAQNNNTLIPQHYYKIFFLST